MVKKSTCGRGASRTTEPCTMHHGAPGTPLNLKQPPPPPPSPSLYLVHRGIQRTPSMLGSGAAGRGNGSGFVQTGFSDQNWILRVHPKSTKTGFPSQHLPPPDFPGKIHHNQPHPFSCQHQLKTDFLAKMNQNRCGSKNPTKLGFSATLDRKRIYRATIIETGGLELKGNRFAFPGHN